MFRDVDMKQTVTLTSETRIPEKGQIFERGGGYTFFWSGRSAEERKAAGVGFAIKTHIAIKLTKILEGINDRLMSLSLPLGKKQNVTSASMHKQ